jgi:hypothetical protein
LIGFDKKKKPSAWTKNFQNGTRNLFPRLLPEEIISLVSNWSGLLDIEKNLIWESQQF